METAEKEGESRVLFRNAGLLPVLAVGGPDEPVGYTHCMCQ